MLCKMGRWWSLWWGNRLAACIFWWLGLYFKVCIRKPVEEVISC